MEKWKDIPEYEAYYQASDLGRIRSVRVTSPLPLSQGECDGFDHPGIGLWPSVRFLYHEVGPL